MPEDESDIHIPDPAEPWVDPIAEETNLEDLFDDETGDLVGVTEE